jgi:hypothetical protein
MWLLCPSCALCESLWEVVVVVVVVMVVAPFGTSSGGLREAIPLTVTPMGRESRAKA